VAIIANRAESRGKFNIFPSLCKLTILKIPKTKDFKVGAVSKKDLEVG